MKLGELLDGITCVEKDMEITGLALDSRQVQSGNAFIALAGSKQHGLIYAGQAVKQGAIAVIYEKVKGCAELLKNISGFNLIEVENLRGVVGEIAARFYNHPSRQLNVIGITGTNGKTSCSQFLAQALNDSGIIGTLGWGDPGKLHKTINTTPDALSIQKILAGYVKQQKKTVVMEVSSHGLDQGRINGVDFTGAVVTNISRDHLDYHVSMEAYVQAKLELMNKPGLKFLVVNLDDDYSSQFINSAAQDVAVWGFSAQGKKSGQFESITAANEKHSAEGIEFEACWNNKRVTINTPVFGEFNLENVLAVFTTLIAMNKSPEEAARKMNILQPVPGRMERFKLSSGSPIVFVDYAHTPDALDKVLAGLKKHCKKVLWVIFGCGGDRDQGKRAQMGQIAVQFADQVVLTNDNPRGEDPECIIKDILSGCKSKTIEVIQDRKTAINKVIERASPGDMVLIAGKGHEEFQEINGKRIPFSDVVVVKESLQIYKKLT